MIATAYAEIIFGFLRDRADQGDLTETVTILELGAGAGRLGYHVFAQVVRAERFCGYSAAPLSAMSCGFAD